MVGRFLMYGALLVLAVFVASTYLILEHGGGTIAQVRPASVHDLTSRPDTYDGEPVTTSGTLQYNNDAARWELIDTDANFPLPITHLEDESLLTSLSGQRVTVSGIFNIDDDGGGSINADTIHATEE